MTAVQPGPPHSPPEGRYGRDGRRFGADAYARSDRTLKVVAIVLGTLTAVALAVFGWQYISGTKVSAQVVSFQVVSDQVVEIHLEVHKDAGTTAVCTVRSVDADQSEVGRKEVRLSQHAKQVDTVVTLETTARGETGELVGCDAASNG